jgi:hypothetical protein
VPGVNGNPGRRESFLVGSERLRLTSLFFAAPNDVGRSSEDSPGPVQSLSYRNMSIGDDHAERASPVRPPG